MAPKLDPSFVDAYSFRIIGDLPASNLQLQGLVFMAGNPNFLLVAGFGRNVDSTIYQISVTRNVSGHVTGYAGPPVFFAAGSDGTYGLSGQFAYGPGNILFCALRGWSISQIKPMQTNAAKRIDFPPPVDETSGLNFVPLGFPGAGHLKVFSWNSGAWQDAVVTPDATGTFNIDFSAQNSQVSGGPSGAAYVAPGNPQFPNSSVLVCFGNPSSWGGIDAYEIDTHGDPIPSTRRSFITNFFAASGATIDPITGDYLFCSQDSTFTNRIIAVSGFNPLHRISGSVSNAQFQGSYRGLWGTNYIVEASSNLSVQSLWKPIQTNTATFDPITFTDAVTNNSPRRFYRLRSQH